MQRSLWLNRGISFCESIHQFVGFCGILLCHHVQLKVFVEIIFIEQRRSLCDKILWFEGFRGDFSFHSVKE